MGKLLLADDDRTAWPSHVRLKSPSEGGGLRRGVQTRRILEENRQTSGWLAQRHPHDLSCEIGWKIYMKGNRHCPITAGQCSCCITRVEVGKRENMACS